LAATGGSITRGFLIIDLSTIEGNDEEILSSIGNVFSRSGEVLIYH
jgi:hypothetical protein